MTIQDALAWVNGGWRSSPYARTIAGVGSGIDVDKSYGFQCFDWVDGYNAFLGNPLFYREGAADLWSTPPPGFTRVADPRPGDIHVYGAPFGWNGKRYLGHTGIVISGTRNSFTSVDQNWNNANLNVGSPPSGVVHSSNGLLGFLRSDNIKAGDDMIPDQDHLNALFRAFFGTNASPDEIQGYVGKISYNKMVEVLDAHPRHQDLLNTINVGKLAIQDKWDQQIYNLEAQVAARDKLLAELKAKADLSDSLQKKVDDMLAEKTKDTETGNAVIRWIGDLFNKMRGQ